MKFCTNDIIAVSSEIGRGHPNYLDGVLEILRRKAGLAVKTYSVFDLSRSSSRATWNLVAHLYRIGGQGGMKTFLYNRLRSNQREGRIFLNMLGRDLRNSLKHFKGNVLVEHPVLARILADICPVYYVHGEIAAPASSAVSSAAKIFVPLEKTKDKFVRWGVKPDQVSVTGLMIEPDLVSRARASYKQRLARFESSLPLTIGFFTSGAYPLPHMHRIFLAAASLIKKGHRAVVFAGSNECLYGRIGRYFSEMGFKISTCPDESPLSILHGRNRIEDTKTACRMLPQLDAFVAAAHERTNWALGLGLPMFVLFPMIGSFARENFLFAQEQGVVYALDTDDKACRFGDIVVNMRRDGILSSMAKNCFGKYSLNGCEKAAEEIIEDLTQGHILK